jgi:branched-chain amino acid transport system substrate-binding protein
MRQMNVNPVIIGGGAGFLWPVFAAEMGTSVNGFVSVASWNWDSKSISSVPELAAITQRYEQKYGTFMTEHAGPTYLAVRMLAQAMEQAKSSDATKVRDALATFDDNHIGGFMQPGVVKIDGNGWDSAVHPVMVQWQDGKPRTVFPLEDGVRAFQKK